MGVYPRACGATLRANCQAAAAWGLSPRMRGNRQPKVDDDENSRSIPAHAGQPLRRLSSRSCQPVYPRACGATQVRALPSIYADGLSPRMRGNRIAVRSTGTISRSIPAHAGQPSTACRHRGMYRVYPRACGATRLSRVAVLLGDGLSPRMRGNRLTYGDRMPKKRSIPAHAGQPKCPRARRRPARVYPRACGATSCRQEGIVARYGLSPRMRGNHAGRARDGEEWRSIPAHAGQPTY